MRFFGPGTVIVLLSLAGCASYEACRSDLTHRFQAARAWHQHAQDCAAEAYPKDFSSGWKEGYLAVTSGSSGEIPPVPPEKYWKERFRTPEGRGQIDAWYSGYQYGVMMAEQEGAGEPRTSRSRRGCIAPWRRFGNPANGHNHCQSKFRPKILKNCNKTIRR